MPEIDYPLGAAGVVNWRIGDSGDHHRDLEHVPVIFMEEHSTESLQGLTVPTTTRANELDEGFIAVRQPASTEKAGGVLSEVVRL